MTWESKESQVLWAGGSPDHGEERVSIACRALHTKDNYPKPLMGKTRRADYLKFLQAAELKGCTVAGVEPGGHSAAPVEKEGRGPGADSVV